MHRYYSKRDGNYRRKLLQQQLRKDDTYGRLKTSSSNSVFDSDCCTHKDDIRFEELVENTATCTYDTNGYVRMQVNNIGDRVVRQSLRYITSRPGIGRTSFITGVLSVSGVAGVRSRMGLFDDHDDKSIDSGGNGHFIERDENGLVSIVQRSSTTGVHQNDLKIPQASWNEDAFDGTGESAISIDFTKSITLVVEDTGALGVTKVGFYYYGDVVTAHWFVHEYVDTPAIKTNTLPVRYEIENVSAASTVSEMRQFSCSAFIEGGYDIYGNVFNYNSMVEYQQTFRIKRNKLGSVDRKVPVFNFRLKTTHSRCTVIIHKLEVAILGSDPASLFIFKNATLTLDDGDVLTWTSMGAQSALEYANNAENDKNYIIDSGDEGTLLVSALLANQFIKVVDDFDKTSDTTPLHSRIDGTPHTYSLVLQHLEGGNVDCAWSMTWSELY